ncbi:hypothetical protein FH972_006858 [Carpinus fangiana]|uniref:Glycosyltransferase n=1 Tax=Carpinus fangiana TaxID=176857 RepID=A0A5N6QVY3_9ROSI|nr:hypothetical protein FH972_006858 [Carpinus fangiana]
MNSMSEPQKLHIAMFPWLAFGHMIPFLELGKLIARKGHHISFISTPRNIERLPKIPPDLALSITFVKLPLPHVENLPENAEATMDVSYHIIPYLKKAHDGLQQPLSRFLETSAPDWIIHDFAPYWLPPIATKLGISRALFSIFNASTWCFLKPPGSRTSSRDAQDPSTRTEPEHFTVPPKWVPFPTKIAYRLFEAKKIFDNIEDNASGVSDWFRVEMAISGTKALVLKTSMEVEGEWLKLIGELYDDIPVIPVGLLPPLAQESGGNNKDSTWDTIGEWLDKQEKESVVYIALGSEIQPSQQDFKELALGLEQSGLPFFWALRKRIELPEGFEERTRGRGVVWTGWVPQLRLLAHQSVGGFLTHCGWGSVTEAFQFGLPLILLPFLTDQGLNARFLEERQVGVEVPRNEYDGSFSSDSVAQTLRLVMKDEKGKIYRDKAKEMSTIIGGKDLQSKYIDKFVEFLGSHRHVITNDTKG